MTEQGQQDAADDGGEPGVEPAEEAERRAVPDPEPVPPDLAPSIRFATQAFLYLVTVGALVMWLGAAYDATGSHAAEGKGWLGFLFRLVDAFAAYPALALQAVALIFGFYFKNALSKTSWIVITGSTLLTAIAAGVTYIFINPNAFAGEFCMIEYVNQNYPADSNSCSDFTQALSLLEEVKTFTLWYIVSAFLMFVWMLWRKVLTWRDLGLGGEGAGGAAQ